MGRAGTAVIDQEGVCAFGVALSPKLGGAPPPRARRAHV